MIAGSTPAVAHAAIRASGVSPRAAASLALIKTTAAAPSLMPDAFPAVTVPSLVKAGFNFASASSVVPARIYSPQIDDNAALLAADFSSNSWLSNVCLGVPRHYRHRLSVLLSITGAALLVVSDWLGGQMVHVYGVGVEGRE